MPRPKIIMPSDRHMHLKILLKVSHSPQTFSHRIWTNWKIDLGENLGGQVPHSPPVAAPLTTIAFGYLCIWEPSIDVLFMLFQNCPGKEGPSSTI